MDKKEENKFRTVFKAIALGVSVTAHILAPLILIGGAGYWLSVVYDSRLILFVSLFLAFIFSNLFVYFRVDKISSRINH